MGYFRRFKPSDYTAEQCRREIQKIETYIFSGQMKITIKGLPSLLEKWACFRELLARHEKSNQSPLDK